MQKSHNIYSVIVPLQRGWEDDPKKKKGKKGPGIYDIIYDIIFREKGKEREKIKIKKRKMQIL